MTRGQEKEVEKERREGKGEGKGVGRRRCRSVLRFGPEMISIILKYYQLFGPEMISRTFPACIQFTPPHTHKHLHTFTSTPISHFYILLYLDKLFTLYPYIDR